MYSFEIREHLDRVFGRMSRKNPEQLKIIYRKIEEILENPQHYKNLRKPLQHLKRVHVGKSFVLLFSVDENLKKVVFEELEHHDKIYQ